MYNNNVPAPSIPSEYAIGESYELWCSEINFISILPTALASVGWTYWLRHRVYSIIFDHKFLLSALTKLGVVLLVKLNGAEECLLVLLRFAPLGWWNWPLEWQHKCNRNFMPAKFLKNFNHWFKLINLKWIIAGDEVIFCINLDKCIDIVDYVIGFERQQDRIMVTSFIF